MSGNRLLVMTALATLLGCGRNPPAAAPPEASRPPECTVALAAGSPQLERLRIEQVVPARVPLEEVIAPGRIQAIPTRVARVALPVAGRVRQVRVGVGDAVKEGQLLFTLDSPEVSALVAAHRQATAEITRAEAALAKAEADLARLRDLFEHGAVARKEVLSAEAELARARADLDRMRAERKAVSERMEILGLREDDERQEVAVRAPLTGKVLEVRLASGEYRNDTTEPVLTLADLRSVWVIADVPESLIRLVTPGERIEVRLVAYPGEIFTGRVARIADTVNPQTRTIEVIAEIANPHGRLRPEMFGEIRHEETFETVPVVPPSAVAERGGKSVVWRERAPGCFEMVEIRRGRTYKELTPVLAGLQVGDRVVVDGVMLLEPPRR
jgi:cobalt-zinc-cadmium efflux system membrane fusion protein